MAIRTGAAHTDITPAGQVWMAGYGDRDRRSEGVYQPLGAGAVYLGGADDEALLIAADLIGFDLAYATQAKQRIAAATGMLPRQVVLTATHTHCAPLFYPMMMPGEPELEYAERLCERLVAVAVFQSAPLTEARGDVEALETGRLPYTCFNPLPSPKRGEMARACWRKPMRDKVSIRSPHRSEGRCPRQRGRAAHLLFQSAPLTEARGDFFESENPGGPHHIPVSIRSPHRSEGRWRNHRACSGRSCVSIRSPHRSEGRSCPYRLSRATPSRFQSAPLTEARGDVDKGILIASAQRFNPLPSPKRGEM